MFKENEWIAKDSQDNATATATQATPGVNRRHIVTHISASYSAAKTALLQLKHGSTVVWEFYVVNACDIEIPGGIRNSNVNEAVSAVLAASGTGGVLGKVNLIGYTVAG